MQTRPLFRLTLWLLPALLLLNILLYAWFSQKTRETSADEVVQKAYIVSRMLSEFSASYLDRGDLAGLKRISEEAFKDRHIVAVTILDSKGKAIIQSTVPRTSARVSTFETPVTVGAKTIATLVTSFSLSESDGMVSSRLRRTAGVQACILSLIAAVLAYACWREKRALVSREYEPISTGMQVMAPESLPLVAAMMADSEAPLRLDELSRVRSSLAQAADLLDAETGRCRRVSGRTQELLERVDLWRREAVQGGGNAEALISSGRDIIAMVLGGAVGAEGGGSCDVGGADAQETDAIAGTLEEIRALVDCLTGELQQAEDIDPRLAPQECLLASAELIREGIATIRHRVFPALASAVGAGENVVTRLSPLLEKVDECGDRSVELTRRSGELFDLADEVRLLRRDLVRDESGDGEGAEGRLNNLATRVESLAALLKNETRDLLGAANEATAAGRSILSTLDSSRDALLAAGSTVEDAAAVSVMGSDHLQSFLHRAGVDISAVSVATPDRENLLAVVQTLRTRLQTLQAAWPQRAEPGPPGREGHAQSLVLACENLLLAGNFLADVAAGAAELAETVDGRAELHAVERTTTGAAIGQLIADANIRLALFRHRTTEEAEGGGE
jgi:hypothetical protein